MRQILQGAYREVLVLVLVGRLFHGESPLSTIRFVNLAYAGCKGTCNVMTRWPSVRKSWIYASVRRWLRVLAEWKPHQRHWSPSPSMAPVFGFHFGVSRWWCPCFFLNMTEFPKSKHPLPRVIPRAVARGGGGDMDVISKEGQRSEVLPYLVVFSRKLFSRCLQKTCSGIGRVIPTNGRVIPNQLAADPSWS